ncbi:Uncharacterized protein PHSC3_001948 [Chlamydiales bacterium STE3]|nr:Uncharacterized protein PHSC3_001948 [Chlamydiales bacterium STE3]
MKKFHPLLILSLLLISFSVSADLFFGREEEPEIVVNNRILLRIHDKAISVIDVMKRMDVHFLKEYPELTSVAAARYQFYQSSWKPVLEELINKELVLADAEENKVSVSSGDIRQEMEQYFGPNIIENLDKIGLSFDEAYKMLEGELIVRRMIAIRVHNKVQGNLTPQAIKKAYDEFAKNNIRKETFRYRVISIKHPDPTVGKATAQSAYELLTSINTPKLEELIEKMRVANQDDKVTITLSNEYTHTESDLADAIKSQLLTLHPKTCSQPFAHKSRTDHSIMYRIVYLEDKTPGGPIPFNEVEMKIRDQLLEQGMAEGSDAYLKKLKKHFDVPETIVNDCTASGFQPFSLKKS